MIRIAHLLLAVKSFLPKPAKIYFISLRRFSPYFFRLRHMIGKVPMQRRRHNMDDTIRHGDVDDLIFQEEWTASQR